MAIDDYAFTAEDVKSRLHGLFEAAKAVDEFGFGCTLRTACAAAGRWCPPRPVPASQRVRYDLPVEGLPGLCPRRERNHWTRQRCIDAAAAYWDHLPAGAEPTQKPYGAWAVGKGRLPRAPPLRQARRLCQHPRGRPDGAQFETPPRGARPLGPGTGEALDQAEPLRDDLRVVIELQRSPAAQLRLDLVVPKPLVVITPLRYRAEALAFLHCKP
jgi:hypothetical protein